LDFNGGLVPVLETPDGSMINESSVIASFAVEKEFGKGMLLWPHECAPAGDLAANMKTAKMRLEMQKFDNFFGKFWGAYMARFNDEEKNAIYREEVPKMEEFFKRNLNGQDYLSGTSEPMMIDIHCYPMVERMVMLENGPWNRGFEAIGMKDAPTICDYVHRFRAHPKLGVHAIRKEAYNKLLIKQDTLEPGVKQQLALEFIQ
jgi:glutathione S-transferase